MVSVQSCSNQKWKVDQHAITGMGVKPIGSWWHFEPPNERVEVQAVKDIYWGGGRGGKLQLVMLSKVAAYT